MLKLRSVRAIPNVITYLSFVFPTNLIWLIYYIVKGPTDCVFVRRFCSTNKSVRTKTMQICSVCLENRRFCSRTKMRKIIRFTLITRMSVELVRQTCQFEQI
jgi:hypothetical protein